MRRLVLSCCAIVLLSASLATPTGAGESAEDALRTAVMQSHEQLVQAFEKGDADGFAALLEPSGELLFFHPIYENLFVGGDRTLDGLRRMFRLMGAAEWTDITTKVRVLGDVAWVMTTSHVVSKRHSLSMDNRGTEVWVNTQSGWRLAHGHWSLNPERILE